ncbi:class I SAM-dependent methyltransferase [Pseudomonas vancouverensis]|uniref:Class I SAM-dependent methyltransferase n=1 Tax=Pseudomonas vancouverensis TaxID=95300 RepID=A0A1H2N1B2_PSEVA|nr:class I SAM-dependent methyltransferase [Pseudomonas vancouverensis]KAB0495705.1 class I SAM-dependent methyltransferase [Pseudomonas vancouverensis]TDB65507.1 class I SAM-dependent methyltransferase [Pseudomonas vancouverensis]SDU98865.1 Methyltransferase domain-containing protein [Pseudomonas vancouverensis]
MEMPTKEQAIASNREAWNDSARHHRDAPDWQALLNNVSQAGFTCLDETLTGLLTQVGVDGKDVVQLACNNGRESLSLYALGARSVVGVDQSSAFLEQARELASRSPHAAQFIEADIHHLPVELHERFDLALITIGVLNWMPDIGEFMCHVAQTLKPGGALVVYETHPFLEMFDPDSVDPFSLSSSYFRREPFVQHEPIVYEGKVEQPAAPSYWFAHTLGDLFTAALAAGLRISHFQEYPHSNREEAYDRYQQRPAQLPLCFTWVVIKD